MICPMPEIENCLEKRCAWWVEEAGECAITAIVKGLINGTITVGCYHEGGLRWQQDGLRE